MTYHPSGHVASFDFFAGEPWIDFHMFQSGHNKRDLDNQRWTLKGRALTPAKPVLDGEPRYEDHPIDWKPEQLGWFDAFDVRQAAWWSMLSGAAGHTYGNHNIWQMWQPGRDPVSHARTPWRQALEHPGAAQMGVMRRILEAHGFGTLKPAQQLLVVAGEDGRQQRAAETADGKTLIVYSPYGDTIRLKRMAVPSGFGARWFDPRTGGQSSAAEGVVFMGDEIVLDPPGTPARGNDWVLVLDLLEIIPT